MDIVSLRRDFHSHPEVGFTEFRTASKVVEILTRLGYQVFYGTEVLVPEARKGVPSSEILEEAYHACRNPDCCSPSPSSV